MTKPKIFNLSSKVLSQQHVNDLRRGLKFTPTPLPNKIELINDVQQFSHKLNFSIRKMNRKKRYPLIVLLQKIN